MRKAFKTLLVASVVLAACFSSSFLLAGERIVRFDVEASVGEDASLTVTESIRVSVEGREIRRGIVRSIPTDFTDDEGRRRRAGFEVLSASLDGRPVTWTAERVGGSVDIRLGDPDVFLSHEEHVFEITYRTTGQIGFFRDHDELYWNVTGNMWDFAIDGATFRLRLPGTDYGEGFLGVEFYTGKSGEQNQEARLLEDGSVETTEGLPPREGLTVVYTWRKGILSPPPVPPEEISPWSASPLRMVHLGIPAALLGIMSIIWLRWGRDPSPRTVIPRFSPPRGVEAGFARHVRIMATDDQGFAAMLLGIAVKGVLVIEERSLRDDLAENMPESIRREPSFKGKALDLLSKIAGRTWRLKIRRERIGEASLTPAERLLVDDLFGGTRSEVHLSSADRPVLQEAFSHLSEGFRARSKSCFNTNIWKWAMGVGFFEVYALATFVAAVVGSASGGEFRIEPLIALMTGPFLVLPLALPISPGRGERVAWIMVRILFPGFFLIFISVFTFTMEGIGVDPLSSAAPLVSGAILALFRPLMRVRSEEGARLAEEIEGLRMYMAAAESSRMERTSPPEATPEHFEALLPYALALDAAETWADRFREVLSGARFQPSWFRGDLGTFATSAGLASFASGLSGAVSSGTRSSGSGGTGSSGGGGGGGGGHGW